MNDFLKMQISMDSRLSVFHLVNIYLASIVGGSPVPRAGDTVTSHIYLYRGPLSWVREKVTFNVNCPHPRAGFIHATTCHLDMSVGVCPMCVLGRKSWGCSFTEFSVQAGASQWWIRKQNSGLYTHNTNLPLTPQTLTASPSMPKLLSSSRLP